MKSRIIFSSQLVVRMTFPTKKSYTITYHAHLTLRSQLYCGRCNPTWMISLRMLSLTVCLQLKLAFGVSILFKSSASLSLSTRIVGGMSLLSLSNPHCRSSSKKLWSLIAACISLGTFYKLSLRGDLKTRQTLVRPPECLFDPYYTLTEVRNERVF
jgi:hypothetical protein